MADTPKKPKPPFSRQRIVGKSAKSIQKKVRKRQIDRKKTGLRVWNGVSDNDRGKHGTKKKNK